MLMNYIISLTGHTKKHTRTHTTTRKHSTSDPLLPLPKGREKTFPQSKVHLIEI